MAQVTITEAARLTEVSEKTIRRKIAAGELSAQVHGQGGQMRKLVDTSELLRVFGALPGQPSPHVQPESPVTPTHALTVSGVSLEPFKQVIDTQKTLIAVLQGQLDARTQETRELRAQVAGLLEWRAAAAPAAAPEPAPVEAPPATTTTPVVAIAAGATRLDRTLAKANLILVVLSVAVSIFVWTWALGYRPWFMVN